jgi:hypothetical protein
MAATRSPRLWADVPPDERVDEAFLHTRAGARDRRWLGNWLRRIASPRCPVALLWPGSALWAPCGLLPVRADPRGRCYQHTDI